MNDQAELRALVGQLALIASKTREHHLGGVALRQDRDRLVRQAVGSGLTHRQIAQAMSISTSRVRLMLTRGLPLIDPGQTRIRQKPDSPAVWIAGESGSDQED